MAKSNGIILFLASSILFAQTARYPSNVVTDQYIKIAKDRATTTLNASLNSTATSFTVVSGAKFAANIIITIDSEQISVCQVSGGTFTVGHSSCPNVDGRGFGGTAAASHANGAAVNAFMTAYNYTAQNVEIKAIETALGASLANITSLIHNPLPVAEGGTASTTAAGARAALSAAVSGSNGDITALTGLSTPLPVNEGGTGSTTGGGARTNLGAAASGSNNDITSLSALSTPLPISEGGTGQTGASAALTAILGSRVIGQSANNVQMATGSVTTGNVPKYDSNGNLIDSGVTPAVVPSGSAPFQRYRSGLGTAFTGAFVGAEVARATDFNFTAIAPGGTLTGGAGAQTVTLVPCPLGIVVSGTFATPLYISAGTGTAEAIKPSGGTCTSGAATGTVVIAPVNNHSGAWTVTSATGGIKEALGYLGSGGGVVWLDPVNSTTLHAAVAFQAANLTVDGIGGASATIQRASDYPAGDLFHIQEATSGYWYHIQNLVFQNNTAAAQASGSAIGAILSRVVITNTKCFGGFRCYTMDSTPGATVTNFEMHGTSHTNALVFFTATTGGFVVTDDLLADGQLYCASGGVAIKIGAADGLLISNVQGGGGSPWLQILPEAGPAYVSNTGIDHVLIDVPNAGQAAMSIAGGGNIQVKNSKFLNGSEYGIIVSGGAAPVQIGPGNQFDYIINSSVQQNAASAYPLLISGNLFTGCVKNSAANIPCVLINVGNAAILGNSFSSDTATWLVSSEGATSNFFLEGNSFTGVSVPYSLDMGGGVVPTHAVVGNNGGIDSVIGSVADAATLVWPPNKNIIVTGSGTTVTQATMTQIPAGTAGTLRTTGGAIPFTATGVIGSAGTTVQNKLYQWFWDGTKLWIYGSGF